MRLLLDTHTLLWHLSGNKNLSDNVRNIIDDPANQVFISQVSLLEMAIKMSLGKLTLPISWTDLLFYVDKGGWVILPIETHDSVVLSQLPFHHGDPFDRILVCQSLNQKLTFISRDAVFDRYGVERVF